MPRGPITSRPLKRHTDIGYKKAKMIYYEAHKEQIKEYTDAYYQKNKELLKEKRRARYAAKKALAEVASES